MHAPLSVLDKLQLTKARALAELPPTASHMIQRNPDFGRKETKKKSLNVNVNY
jgi:hypothetical protein